MEMLSLARVGMELMGGLDLLALPSLGLGMVVAAAVVRLSKGPVWGL